MAAARVSERRSPAAVGGPLTRLEERHDGMKPGSKPRVPLRNGDGRDQRLTTSGGPLEASVVLATTVVWEQTAS